MLSDLINQFLDLQTVLPANLNCKQSSLGTHFHATQTVDALGRCHVTAFLLVDFFHLGRANPLADAAFGAFFFNFV